MQSGSFAKGILPACLPVRLLSGKRVTLTLCRNQELSSQLCALFAEGENTEKNKGSAHIP